MHPAVPDPSDEGGQWVSADDVGAFEQGTEFSRWALARYLVGRAIGQSVGDTLMVIAVLLILIAVALGWLADSVLGAVLVGIVAACVLLLRWAVLAVLRRLTSGERYGPYEKRLREMVHETHGDTLRELRRVGLPGHLITLPVLAIRLIGRRRQDTLTRLRAFEVERAVPKARLDELHMLLRGELR